MTWREEEEDFGVAARREREERWEGSRDASAQKRMAAAETEKKGQVRNDGKWIIARWSK